MLLYHAGLSYNKTAVFVNASYEAVRKWYRKGRKLFEQTLETKKRKRIAIDEKEIRINGMKIFKIWGVKLMVSLEYQQKNLNSCAKFTQHKLYKPQVFNILIKAIS